MARRIQAGQTVVVNMTKGSVLPLIIRFAIPIFIGSVFQQIYSVVDTMVAGHVLGDSAIAAIGATSTLYGLIIQISLGLAGGFVLVITRCFGWQGRSVLSYHSG